MNKNEIRNLFPFLSTGKIYFNHAAISPFSSVIVEEFRRYAHQRSATDVNNWPGVGRTIAEAKVRIGRLLNVKSDRIAFTENVTNGINLLASGIKWEKGDRIILNDLEFPANVYPFMNLQKQGVEIDFVKSADGKIRLEDIEKAITERTKLLSISHVQFLTGYRADMKAIGEICMKHGIIFCADVIQSAGAMMIDAQNWGVDFIAGGSQKWLMAMQGLGYVYVSEKLQEMIQPAYAGWTSVKDPWNLLDFNLELVDDASRYENGTLNVLGICVLNKSLGFFETIGYENIEKQIIDNSVYFRDCLSAAGISPVMKNACSSELSGIVSFNVNNGNEIFDELVKKDIIGSYREGLIRFSPHFYNTKEEIDKVIKEIRKLL